MYPELRDSGILVTNPSGIFSEPMAEHTIGLMIALARNFPGAVRHQDQRRWAQQELWDKPQHLTELGSKTLLIVGFGSIGQELARGATALRMLDSGVSRSGRAVARTPGTLVQREGTLKHCRLSAGILSVALPEKNCRLSRPRSLLVRCNPRARRPPISVPSLYGLSLRGACRRD